MRQYENIRSLLTVLVTCGLLLPPPVFASGIFNMNATWRQQNIEPSWIGASFTSTGAFSTGVGVTSASADGVFSNPSHVSSDGTYLYVSDQANHRITKHNASTGAFVGWIGNISLPPTGGDAGCKGAAAGTFTPGWCTGGTAKSGSGDGMLNTPLNVFVRSGSLYVADKLNHRISRYSASTGAFTGWIGNIATSPTGGDTGCSGAAADTATPGWCLGGTSKSGAADGMFNSPGSSTIDGSGFLYVSDSSNQRIQKFTASTGAFIGWIGNINTSPTGGDAGCNGAAVSSFTPGWCTGGSGKSGTGDGMLSDPANIIVVGTVLYVVEVTNKRVSKFTASSGAFGGWIGNIATSPTGGAAGCNGAAADTFTAGWCFGGTSKTGTGNGMMSSPNGIFVDGSDNLYVADSSNNRISKYVASTGAFVGWIGNINTSPTGGAAGCNGAAVSTFTPGWCTGGTAKLGTGDGMVKAPYSVFVDGSGNLFVAEYTNHRISKYTASSGAFVGALGGKLTAQSWTSVSMLAPGAGSADGMFNLTISAHPAGSYLYVTDNTHRVSRFDLSTGAFAGWIGKIATSPTGGDAGCNGAAVGTFTPGWCIGGTSTSGSGDGMLYTPYHVYFDSGFLYVTEYTNSRVSKFNATTGAFVGWIGKISTSPTGGDAGCNGAAVGTFTPGWCTGGTGGSSTAGNGSMNAPHSSLIYGIHLYVSDHSNHRINKYVAATGAFVGWIGKIGTSPTGGDAGCNGAAVGTFTPGWCTGGTASSGTGDGMFNVVGGIAMDTSGNLYAPDTNNYRIQKFNSATGAFIGWIGRIATSPTGGDAGCIGAAVDSFTPGWCTGGTSKSGTGDGTMAATEACDVDSAGFLYVVDYGNSRINRYKANTGAFLGWMGQVKTSPTGGAAGCNGAAVNTLTPGWCTGGTSKSGTKNGMLQGPIRVKSDGAGLVYVTDFMNSRIVRYRMKAP